MEVLLESEEKEKLISECLKMENKLKKLEKEWRVKIKRNLKIKQLNRLLDDKLLVLLWQSLEDGDYRKVFAVKECCRVLLNDVENEQDSSNNKAAKKFQLVLKNNENKIEANDQQITIENDQNSIINTNNKASEERQASLEDMINNILEKNQKVLANSFVRITKNCNELETSSQQEINKTCDESKLETIEQGNNEITQENELETNDQQTNNQVIVVLGGVINNSVENDHQVVLITGNSNEFETVSYQQANNQVKNAVENDQIVPRIIENCDEFAMKHLDERSFRCDQDGCDKSFDRKDHLDSHLQNHLALRPLQCQWKGCGKRLKTTKRVINHLKRLHRRFLTNDQLEVIEKLTLEVVEDDKKVIAINESDVFIGDILEKNQNDQNDVFKCSYPGCGNTFESKIIYNCHKKIHTTKCQHCQKCFKKLSELKIHHRIHTGEKPYECDWDGCGKRFRIKSQLDIHKNTKHSNERPFKCLECGCGKSFKKKSILKRHLEHHSTELPFQCPKKGCGKRFKTKSNLHQHVNYFHSEVRNFQCEFENCQKTFKTGKDLRQHQKTHK